MTSSARSANPRTARAATADPRAILARITANVFHVPPFLTVSQWAAEHRTVVRTDGGLARWNPSATPYLNGIMDAMHDPRVRVISVMKGSQTGGTEALYNILFYAIDRRPGLALMFYPDRQSAIEQARVRFLPNAKATPCIAARIGPRARDTKAQAIRFDRMDVLWRGTWSEHSLESFAAPLVIVDELDRCEPRTGHLVRQRTKTIPGAKVILNGKPGLANEGIHAEYCQSDRRRWFVPCPSCGVYHVRALRDVRWPGRGKDGKPTDSSRDPEADRATASRQAFLKCPNRTCGARIEGHHNRWQLGLGVWAASGQSVRPLAKTSDDADPTTRFDQRPGDLVGAGPDTDHAGFHLSGLDSGLRPNPYEEAVEGLLARKGRVDQDFINDQLGEAWEVRGARTDIGSLRRLAPAPPPRGTGYLAAGPPGTRMVPQGVLAILAGVDVQVSGAYVVIRGFGARGRDQWLVWHGHIHCPEHTGLAPVADLLGSTFTREDGKRLSIYAGFIDSGDRTKEVYDLCRGGPRRFAVKGVSSDQMEAPHKLKRLDLYPDGKPMPGGVQLLRVNADLWKRDVSRRMAAAIAALPVEAADPGERKAAPSWADEDLDPGAGWDGLVPDGAWHLPYDVSDEYLSQVTAEECVRTTVGTRVKHVWKMRPGRVHNHYGDCEVYAQCGFDALGGARLGANAAKAAPVDPTKAADAVVDPRTAPPPKPARESRPIRSPMLDEARAMRGQE